MAQITTGLRRALSNPHIYNLFQRIMGSHKTRSEISAKHIRAEPGMKVLDLGCGPCEVLSYLPAVSYSGYDISEAYVQMARNRYGNRGQFYAKNYTADDIDDSQKFDVVLALGVLHHLSAYFGDLDQ